MTPTSEKLNNTEQVITVDDNFSRKQKKVRNKSRKNKNTVVEDKGITGMGTDYKVYILSSREKMTSLLAGFLIGFVAAYIYFGNGTLAIIVGCVAAWRAVPMYQKHLLNKRKKELRLQFRDMLESLSNSFTVGMTSSRAFHAAYDDMLVEHGSNSYIAEECGLICATHDNQGVEIRDLVTDFGQRSGIDDIKSFGSIFRISTELGGDIGKVVRETRDMIGEKIETELEIQTMITGQKNQLNILMIMPFVAVMFSKTLSSGDGSSGAIIAVKIAALAIFVFAYWLGTRIVDIKV